jgi:hypothetical protein
LHRGDGELCNILADLHRGDDELLRPTCMGTVRLSNPAISLTWFCNGSTLIIQSPSQTHTHAIQYHHQFGAVSDDVISSKHLPSFFSFLSFPSPRSG